MSTLRRCFCSTYCITTSPPKKWCHGRVSSPKTHISYCALCHLHSILSKCLYSFLLGLIFEMLEGSQILLIYLSFLHPKNRNIGKRKTSCWHNNCVCVCPLSYKFLINLKFEPVTSSLTFPTRSASLLSSLSSWLTHSSVFIITAVGSVSVPRRTWKLNIWTWSCFTYIAAFMSHLWGFFT